MNVLKIKEILESNEYDFLRTREDLKENIILLTTGGSYAYGTNIEGSDLDIRGVMKHSHRELLTMKCHEEPFLNRETDTTIYPLKQIVDLLSNCNPNTVEILGTSDEHLFIITEEGKLLRDNINIFLSKRAVHSFGGYATQQLRRLQNALARDSYPQSEKEQHILNSLAVQMDHLMRHYAQFTGEEIKLYLDKSAREDFDKEIFMDVKLTHYPLRDFKCIYSEMSNVIKDYDKLNHRNKKKDDIHLNKHAMHLIRLLIKGTEVLEGKRFTTHVGEDLKMLMKIRNGKFSSYEAIFRLVDKYEKRFQYAAKYTNLPDKPDVKKIEELVIEINKKTLRMI